QAAFSPDGRTIAANPTPTEPERPLVLSSGQMTFGPDGQPVAENPAQPIPPRLRVPIVIDVPTGQVDSATDDPIMQQLIYDPNTGRFIDPRTQANGAGAIPEDVDPSQLSDEQLRAILGL